MKIGKSDTLRFKYVINDVVFLDQMEYFLRLHSKNAKLVAQKLRLRDKKTG